jgi:pyruvate-formate lyase-activating enzyme
MFDKLKKLFCKNNTQTKNLKYCRYLNTGITFMHFSVRTCCSNKCGVTFINNYKGEKIDWKKINKQRKDIINNAKKGILPKNCLGCVELKDVSEWPKTEKPMIKEIFFNHFDHCNCGCIYCINTGHADFLVEKKKPSKYYNVLNEVKTLLDKKLVSHDSLIEIIGGDLTVLDESDEIINRFIDYGIKYFAFHSSCIDYSQAIENAFKSNITVHLDFSIDCGTREKYKQIKRIDAFDKVIENIKKYMSFAKPDIDTIVAKYIIIDGVNDNLEDFSNWVELIHSLGIKQAKIDVNFLKYFSECNPKEVSVPSVYYEINEYFQKKVAEYGIIDCCWEFSKRVLAEGGRPKGY